MKKIKVKTEVYEVTCSSCNQSDNSNIGGTQADFEQIVREDGWTLKDSIWLCPACFRKRSKKKAG